MKLSDKFKQDLDQITIPDEKINNLMKQFDPARQRPINRLTPWLLTAILLFSAVGIGFISYTLTTGDLAEDDTQITTEVIAGDYATYERLDELIAATDLIIRGTVSVSEKQFGDVSNTVVPYTVSTLMITETYKKDDSLTNESEIQVKQMVNDTENGLFVSTSDERPLETNKEYVLFLTSLDETSTSLINPTQGMYEVQNEHLTGLGMNQLITSIQQISEIVDKQKNRQN